MAIWSLIAAPLIMGNDVRKVDAESSRVLLNKEVVLPASPHPFQIAPASRLSPLAFALQPSPWPSSYSSPP